MSDRVFNVRFVSGPKLQPGEHYWPWDEDCGGTVHIQSGSIALAGKRKTGAAVDVLTLGPAQQLLKRSVAGDMTEVIDAGDLVRVVARVTPGKKTAAFRFYQRRGDGTIAVHPIVTGLMKADPDPDEVLSAMVSSVTVGVVTDEAGSPLTPSAPADWYPDPAGVHELRFWDGARWTEHVSDGGQQAQDAL